MNNQLVNRIDIFQNYRLNRNIAMESSQKISHNKKVNK